MRPWKILALLVVVGSTGCGATLHQPRPDLDRPVSERPWRVHCEWSVAQSTDRNEPLGHRETGWSWAKDVANRRLVVEGHLKDGFFEVDRVAAHSDEDDRDVEAMPATADAVAEACLGTLRRQEPIARRGLSAMRAARDGENINMPLVFPADPKKPRPISRMVVFGDSLSDAGNLKKRLLVFPSSPYWHGRFSNGPNWTDYVSAATGISIQNHAYGGAAATRHDDVPPEHILASIEEGAQFFLTGSIVGQVRDHLERDMTDDVLERPHETVYVLWGGANDYISKEPFTGEIGTLLNSPEGEAGYRRIVDEAVSSLVGQVRLLYAAGARQFLVLNLPNLGATPIALQNRSYVPPNPTRSDDARRLELSRKLTELTRHHNHRLHEAIRRLDAELPPASILEVDTARAIDELLESRSPDPSGRRFDYGFTLGELGAELRDGRRRVRIQDRCYEGGYLGTHDRSKVCANPHRAMFWDVVHPTSYTHCWVAFFVEREMAKAGWVVAGPSPEEQKAICEESAARGF